MNQQPQRYYIDNKEIQEEKLLSEGGYGYIWRAYDVRTRQVFALKKMICQGKDRIQVAQNELAILKALPNHPNVVNYHGSLIQRESDERVIFYILMEFCSGGSLFDLMAKDPDARFPESQILNIVRDVVNGIKSMHEIPLAHRDIKIENILYEKGKYKLCDFGSASRERIDFINIDKNDFYKYEEFYEKNTTLMYRPPEMADLFQRYQVNEKVDIWMLGCVIFTLCFFIHPFAESQKLAIVNAAYIIPKNHNVNSKSNNNLKYSSKMTDFIRLLLTPNPKFRPSIFDVEKILMNWDRMQSIPLNVWKFQYLEYQAQAQEIKNRHIQADKEMESYEKNIKKFDGDIPMDELMKLQQKIRQEQENENSDKYSNLGRGPQKQRKQAPPPQQAQKPQVQSNDWGNFGASTNQGSSQGWNFSGQQSSTPIQQSNNFGEWNQPVFSQQSQPQVQGFNQWGQQGTSQSNPNQFGDWGNIGSNQQWPSEGQTQNQLQQVNFNWSNQPEQPQQNQVPQWGQSQNLNQPQSQQPSWSFQAPQQPINQSKAAYQSNPIQQSEWNQQSVQPQMIKIQSLPLQQSQPIEIDLIGLEAPKKSSVIDLRNITL